MRRRRDAPCRTASRCSSTRARPRSRSGRGSRLPSSSCSGPCPRRGPAEFDRRRASPRATTRWPWPVRLPRPRTGTRRPVPPARPARERSTHLLMGRLRWLTAGESHGRSLAVTVEGVPAGLAIGADDLAVDLARRQRGYGRGARQAIEHDQAEIVSGVRHGVTLGSPILLLVANRDWDNWTAVMQVEGLTDEEGAALAAAVAEGN